MSSTPALTEVRKAAKAYEKSAESAITKFEEVQKELYTAATDIGGPESKKNKKKVEQLRSLARLCIDVGISIAKGKAYAAFCGEEHPSTTSAYDRYCKATTPEEMNSIMKGPMKNRKDIPAGIEESKGLYLMMRAAARDFRAAEDAAGVKVTGRELPNGNCLVAGFPLDPTVQLSVEDFYLNPGHRLFDISSDNDDVLSEKLSHLLSASAEPETGGSSLFETLPRDMEQVARSVKAFDGDYTNWADLTQQIKHECDFRREGRLRYHCVCFPAADHDRSLVEKADPSSQASLSLLWGSDAMPIDIVQKYGDHPVRDLAKRMAYERGQSVQWNERGALEDSELQESCSSIASRMQGVASLLSRLKRPVDQQPAESKDPRKRRLSLGSSGEEGSMAKRAPGYSIASDV